MTNLNGIDGNQGSLGRPNQRKEVPLERPPYREVPPLREFEQPVVLRQSPVWSRAIVWTIVGLATFGVTWASFARIEQVVPAKGLLKPQGAVKEVQAPVSGVVKAVYVENGDRVEPGDLLVSFDSTAALAELESLKEIRNSLTQETQFYRRLMGQAANSREIELAILELKIPAEIALLARNRAELEEENDLFAAQIQGKTGNARLNAAQLELRTRQDAAQREVDQRRKQLEQTKIQINQTRVQRGDIQSQLATATVIRDNLSRLNQEGAFPNLQFLQQKQEVQSLEAEVNRLDQEIIRLQKEEERLNSTIAQAQSQLIKTTVVSEVDLRDRIADNRKRIAEIDSQLSKTIVENDKGIAEINSQISQTQLNLRYQEMRAPVAGTIFNMQAKSAGFVANPSEVLLEIVPEDSFVAEVFITNADIGFVRQKMDVDVRVDTFPFSEFGDIQGEVISIGSDALPPDELYNYYRFPATVSLNSQTLRVDERNIPLQSGMSVSANIIVRENRTVMSLFTEKFTKQVESLKEVR